MKEEENKEEVNMEEEALPRIYEVGFHIVPTIHEDNINSVASEVRGAIESSHSMILNEDIPKEPIKLAYPMDSTVGNKKKVFDTGYFCWIKFETTPEKISSIEEKLKKNTNIFRFLIIKTLRESTFNPTVLVREAGKASVVSEENADDTLDSTKKDDKKEISEKEVDKAIDELMVE